MYLMKCAKSVLCLFFKLRDDQLTDDLKNCFYFYVVIVIEENDKL